MSRIWETPRKPRNVDKAALHWLVGQTASNPKYSEGLRKSGCSQETIKPRLISVSVELHVSD